MAENRAPPLKFAYSQSISAPAVLEDVITQTPVQHSNPTGDILFTSTSTAKTLPFSCKEQMDSKLLSEPINIQMNHQHNMILTQLY